VPAEFQEIDAQEVLVRLYDWGDRDAASILIVPSKLTVR